MVYKWDITIPQLSGSLRRRAYIYLPEEYDLDPQRRYPVLYMFDGQNVFFDQDATYGKSWGMNDYMEQTHTPLIIAAVECSSVGNGRMEEYSPFSHTSPGLGPISARGRTYMRWLIRTFKAEIDQHFRTLPDRDHTFIAGSSMGGLMALYAVCHFNDTFSRAACLSPSLWLHPGKVNRMLKNSRPASDTLIYLDYGSLEMDNHAQNREALFTACRTLWDMGLPLTFRIVPGGTHSEASWEQQVPVFMKCLGF